ncbi:MAG: hypothetical protein V3W19_08295 [Desulfatiglandales bacterium]
MFRQVIWTLCSLMERFESYWKGVRGSESVETFGYEGYVEPEPVPVDLEGMVEHFKMGLPMLGFESFTSWQLPSMLGASTAIS